MYDKKLQKNTLAGLRKELKQCADPKRAEVDQIFFKTKKGQYGAGDVFLGLTVPQTRGLARMYAELSFVDLEKLLHSKIHEERLIALLVLVYNFEKGEEKERKKIFDFYIKNTRSVNNWDLVDLSAYKIVGAYVYSRDKKVLYRLAKSANLWEKRIAIVSSYFFIKNNKFEDTLAIAEMLLRDPHDLIHKAVGWMLREVGNRSPVTEEVFLKEHYKIMPRTMLRYAIEKFPEEKRIAYLKGKME